VRNKLLHAVIVIIALFSSIHLAAQTTSWKGTVSTSWSTAGNWTNGVPTAALDAVIGDVNFTGSYMPTIGAKSFCKSLIVGGSVAATLSFSRSLTVSGDVTINRLQSTVTVQFHRGNQQ
jgi:fibronectin-binding autotransporter adhesin